MMVFWEKTYKDVIGNHWKSDDRTIACAFVIKRQENSFGKWNILYLDNTVWNLTNA